MSWVPENLTNAANVGVEPHIPARDAARDCLFLSLIILLSFVLYIKDLGFYSDDWMFLGLLSNSSDQSIFGLFRAVVPYTRLRPIESLYVAGPYWLFGANPLAFHLINSAVFTITILLFYLSLREVFRARAFAVAIPLVYALLPHYSSDRFWFIAFVIPLSIGFYFLSLYSDLRACRAPQGGFWKWKICGTIAMVCSALSYEVVLPLFLINPLVVWFRARQIPDIHNKKAAIKVFQISLVANLLVIVLAIAYKLLTARGDSDLFVHRMGITEPYPQHLVRLVVGALGVNYGSYGVAFPVKVWRVLRDYPKPSVIALAIVVGLLVFFYIYRRVGSANIGFTTEKAYFRMLGVGLTVFALGYAIFLTNSQVGFTATGIKNRSAIAAAIGVAISFVAVIGWVSWLLPSFRASRTLFAFLISSLCVGGFLINNTIAGFWTDAYRQQREIISAVRDEFPVMEPDTTLILDGACPYSGPGIIFECYWDVGGMLKTYYRDVSLKGDMVRKNLKVEEDGLYTSIYGERKLYPYSESLVVFDVGQRKTYRLPDAESARRYFGALTSDKNKCPPGDEGYGAPIF